MPDEREDNAPVTAALLTKILDLRVSTLEASLETKFDAGFTKLDDRITAVRAELIERIEDTETRLLKEFQVGCPY